MCVFQQTTEPAPAGFEQATSLIIHEGVGFCSFYIPQPALYWKCLNG